VPLTLLTKALLPEHPMDIQPPHRRLRPV